MFLVEKIVPKGKYGKAYGKCFVDGKPDDSYRLDCYPQITNDEIPCAGCGEWYLMDVPGIPMEEIFPPIKATDTLEFGKYKGKTFQEIYQIDEQYLHWLESTEHFLKIDYTTFETNPNTEKNKLLNPDFTINFGKYKGKTAFEIYSENASYLDWLESQNADMHFDWVAIENRNKKSGLPPLPKHGELYAPEHILQFSKYKGKTIFEIYCTDSIELYNLLNLKVDWQALDKLYKKKKLDKTETQKPYNPILI